jgi:hypothetical protein
MRRQRPGRVGHWCANVFTTNVPSWTTIRRRIVVVLLPVPHGVTVRSMLTATQTPWVGQMRPFVLATPDQFLPAPPPSLSSAEWVAAFDEIEVHGSNTNPNRGETAVARFWTANVIRQYNRLARDVATVDPTSVKPTGDGFGPVPGFADGNPSTAKHTRTRVNAEGGKARKVLQLRAQKRARRHSGSTSWGSLVRAQYLH